MRNTTLTTKEKVKVAGTIIFSIVIFVVSLLVVPAEFFVVSTFPVFMALRSIEKTYLKMGNHPK
ncbi:MAG: hypothetical protein HYV29_14565 [Ignavibacteriales bacterium]|nr:hypothetical protein [Ignavibacteriales bacterium]